MKSTKWLPVLTAVALLGGGALFAEEAKPAGSTPAMSAPVASTATPSKHAPKRAAKKKKADVPVK